jgi:hypothetical protein
MAFPMGSEVSWHALPWLDVTGVCASALSASFDEMAGRDRRTTALALLLDSLGNRL